MRFVRLDRAHVHQVREGRAICRESMAISEVWVAPGGIGFAIDGAVRVEHAGSLGEHR